LEAVLLSLFLRGLTASNFCGDGEVDVVSYFWDLRVFGERIPFFEVKRLLLNIVLILLGLGLS
jgi:hypothetical protein